MYGDSKEAGTDRGRHFHDVIILLCVRWCQRYSLTYRGGAGLRPCMLVPARDELWVLTGADSTY